MTAGSDKTEALAQALAQAGEALADGLEGVAGQHGADLGSRGIAMLVDDALGAGERLARIGDCSLVVAVDRLSACLRGPLPEGTTYDEVMGVVQQAGIRFGLIPARIHEALPRRRPRRGRRPRRTAESDVQEVQIARGEPPTPPAATRVTYHFDVVDESEAADLNRLLRDDRLTGLQKTRLRLPFARPGQELASLHECPGRSGRDVFGEEVLPPIPTDAALAVGDNVELAADGQSCMATACGYACVLDGAVHVLSPLWIAKDLMSAWYLHLPWPGEGPIPSEEDLHELLERHEVVHGVDEAALAKLGMTLREGTAGPRCVPLARGTEAVQGTRSRWSFAFDTDLTGYCGQIERILDRARRPAFLRAHGKGLAGLAVNAGQRLATRKPGQDGEMGRDVFGEEFMPEDPREERLEAGDHVAFADDGESCHSQIFGYAGVDDSRVRVVSPIWIDPTLTRAFFLNLPQLGERRFPSPAEIGQLLELADVRYGVDDRAIGVLCEKIRQDIATDLAVPVARGKTPVPGVDGRFEFAVDIERKPGLFRADGSVDFRQVNLSPVVAVDQPVGLRTAARAGEPGMDLWQRQIPAREGQEIVVHLGKNVRCLGPDDAETDPGQRYLAEIEGELAFVDHRHKSPPSVFLAVHRTMVVHGDVDFDTGDIDYPGNVQIEGAVRPGFAVKAEGNVSVGDSLDPGAVVEAGGNVAVRFGVSGTDTRVTAQGSVFAKFINGARVQAHDQVVVGAYIRAATVKAGREVVVAGGTRGRLSGAIIGGLVLAGRRVAAQVLGSPAGERTHVVAGVDPALLQRLAALQRLLEQTQAVTDRILAALEVKDLDPARRRQVLVALLMSARGPRRKTIAQSIKNLTSLQQRSDQARREKEALEAEAARTAAEGIVEVAGAVAVKTVVRLGDQTRAIRDEGTQVSDVCFVLHRKPDGTTEIRMRPNSG